MDIATTIDKKNIFDTLAKDFWTGGLSLDQILEIVYDTAEEITGEECVGYQPCDLKGNFEKRRLKALDRI